MDWTSGVVVEVVLEVETGVSGLVMGAFSSEVGMVLVLLREGIENLSSGF